MMDQSTFKKRLKLIYKELVYLNNEYELMCQQVRRMKLTVYNINQDGKPVCTGNCERYQQNMARGGIVAEDDFCRYGCGYTRSAPMAGKQSREHRSRAVSYICFHELTGSKRNKQCALWFTGRLSCRCIHLEQERFYGLENKYQEWQLVKQC